MVIDRAIEYYKNIAYDQSGHSNENGRFDTGESNDINFVYFDRDDDPRDHVGLFTDHYYEKHKLDIDIPLLFHIVLEFYSNTMLNNENLSRFIVFRNDEQPPFKNKSPYCYMVQTLNEFNVVTKDNEVILCRDFCSCFIKWIDVNRSDKETNGKIKGESWDFEGFYNMVIKGISDNVSFQKQQDLIMETQSFGDGTAIVTQNSRGDNIIEFEF